MKKIIITSSIVALLLIFGYLFYREGSLPVDSTVTDEQVFVIAEGEAINSIINRLASQHLIRNRIVFYTIVKQKGIERDIQAGDFRLSPNMSAPEIADELTHGTIDVWVTIPEGLRKEEIAEIMNEKFSITETLFNDLSQEGHLFPDTYLIPKNPSAEQVISILTNTFDQRFSDEMRAKAAQLNLTEEQVVTIASLVEREAKTADDRQKVASVILRRVRAGMPLQIDATVQYALGYQPQEKDWWKKALTLEDLKYESPYNTYVHAGLPPGSICNPGLASLEAVTNADPNTPYLFYVSDSQGVTHFSKTYDEHLQNIEKYL
ncbi:endolytic transglycosylase MltG [Candidatus Woesebacteria bacterium]|nr:endolytic transglycosylase MltG [Candidatus Woesebacteria bacterium]